MLSLHTSEYQHANSVAESQCVPQQNALSKVLVYCITSTDWKTLHLLISNATDVSKGEGT